MPLLLHKSDEDYELAVWEIDEDPGFFMDSLDIRQEIVHWLDGLPDIRKAQWLAARYTLLRCLQSVSRCSVRMDRHGKPFFTDSAYHCSISHSSNYAAAAAGKSKIGVDVQVLRETIGKIKNKFVHTEELPLRAGFRDEIDFLHIVWGAKESMYKAFGRKSVSFKDNIHITSVSGPGEKYTLSGQLSKSAILNNYRIQAFTSSAFYLVCAYEI